ncbi:hypothetical protein BCR34DRAFT_178765 [Clohesyomyces aquaticus]|uniref:Uncharacterized protein n=1 Tax=Clohesyomyces aquaticus TaxID=1231657 RepID=A0A1Y1ZZ37_9PLEO|nr:hypothetical protein BCR34DRAFT_178765 [Clohesyomyces aquaticus]
MTSYYILQYSQPGVLGTSKNGVALVPTTTDDENSWEQNIAYTYNQLTFHHSQTTATDMDSTAADAAKMVKNAYLIFSDGKRVVVPPDQIQYFDAVMQNTKPLQAGFEGAGLRNLCRAGCLQADGQDGEGRREAEPGVDERGRSGAEDVGRRHRKTHSEAPILRSWSSVGDNLSALETQGGILAERRC